MQAYRTTEAIRTAADTHPDLELRHLLTERIHSLEAFDDLPGDLGNLLQVGVLEPMEGAAALETLLGGRSCFSSFLQPGFYPTWEVIEAHGHWFELTFVLSDDGAGVVVFVPMTADAELLAMCARYAVSKSLP